MDQRRAPRFPLGKPVTLIMLAENTPCSAIVKDVSAGGIGLITPARLQPGAAVAIELDDCLILGEVAYCQAAGDSYSAGVALSAELIGIAHLRKLSTRLGFLDREAESAPPALRNPDTEAARR